MRGIVGRICHGPERRPLEPHGIAAPALRIFGWSMLFLSSLTGLLSVAAYWAQAVAVIGGLIVCTGLGVFAGLILLVYARLFRPHVLVLAAPAREPRS